MQKRTVFGKEENGNKRYGYKGYKSYKREWLKGGDRMSSMVEEIIIRTMIGLCGGTFGGIIGALIVIVLWNNNNN